MRHIIDHLIRREAKDYHIELTKDLFEKFDVFPIHDSIPSYLTLQRWFELSDHDLALLQ